jgi:hypothetical protein
VRLAGGILLVVEGRMKAQHLRITGSASPGSGQDDRQPSQVGLVPDALGQFLHAQREGSLPGLAPSLASSPGSARHHAMPVLKSMP